MFVHGKYRHTITLVCDVLKVLFNIMLLHNFVLSIILIQDAETNMSFAQYHEASKCYRSIMQLSKNNCTLLLKKRALS